MKARVASLNKTDVARSTLGILAALLVLAALGGWRLSLISGARAAFVALLGMGCMLCALGALSNIPPGRWSHPLNLVAILLGNLGALLSAAILSDVKLPLISSQRAAFVALLIVGGVLSALGSVRNVPPRERLRHFYLVVYVLGSLALLLGAAVVSGVRVPLVSGERAALVSLAGIVLFKMVLARLHHGWRDRLPPP